MEIKQRNTSVQAYYDIINSLPDRRKRVYEALLDLKVACNLDIAEYLNIPINQVTPRTNELVNLDVVSEDHRGLCARTNKRVIYWKVNRYEENGQGHLL